MIYAPIYKDTYYESDTDVLFYRITLDDGATIIYAGQARRMPGADHIRVKVNDICRNWLSSNLLEFLSTTATTQTHPDACRTFQLHDLTNNLVETYRFLLSYDRTFGWTGQTATLSNPINGRYIEGMKVPNTFLDGSGQAVTFANTGAGYTTAVCADKALWYLNSRGGWDIYAFEGKAARTDKFTSYSTERAYDNTALEFGYDRYLIETETTWELNTRYFGGDEESERICSDLIPSPKVYMYDSATGGITPVVITNDSVAVQHSPKLYQYKITVKESQTKTRT